MPPVVCHPVHVKLYPHSEGRAGWRRTDHFIQKLIHDKYNTNLTVYNRCMLAKTSFFKKKRALWSAMAQPVCAGVEPLTAPD